MTPMCIAHRRPLTAELGKPLAIAVIPFVAQFATSIWFLGWDLGYAAATGLLLIEFALFLMWARRDLNAERNTTPLPVQSWRVVDGRPVRHPLASKDDIQCLLSYWPALDDYQDDEIVVGWVELPQLRETLPVASSSPQLPQQGPRYWVR